MLRLTPRRFLACLELADQQRRDDDAKLFSIVRIAMNGNKKAAEDMLDDLRDA